LNRVEAGSPRRKADAVDGHETRPDPAAEPARLSVVIVNYRSWPDVARLVAVLGQSPANRSGESELLVIDNASGEPIPPALLDPTPGLSLILRPENDGFSAGVNAGWRAAKGRWLLVLNPDVVADAGLIGRVLDRIEAYEARPEGPPGIVGFGLRNPDGSRQPSVGAFPGLFRAIREQLIPRSRRKYQPEWRLRPGPVDWVTGASMLIDRRLLDDLGGMDEDFFLYYEEVALCRSALRLGRIVEFDPGVEVVHLRPLQNRPVSPKMRVITRHSKLLYFRKHLPRWQFAALGAAIRLEAGFRQGVSRAIGDRVGARSWQAVGRVAKLLAAGADLRGRAVRDLAETVDADEDPAPARIMATALESSRQTHARPHGTRPVQPRKDGASG
jgi:N-acetylglucosaminyl-diphospho-decaprenol L-rhamnosyltransferase